MKNLREERKKSGLSQLDLAKFLGVTDRTIRNWESGTTKVRKGFVVAIKKFLNCNERS